MAFQYQEIKEDVALDRALRPKTWDEFIGQEAVKGNLRILVDAAKGRNEPLDHVLIVGPAGIGKTTLAHLVAREMGANLRATSGPAIERVGDLASILTNLDNGDILFIDEAHRLPRIVEEILYPAMESRTLDIVLGKGTAAHTIQLDLPAFTLVAATTRGGLLSSPLRSRFGAIYYLDFYRSKDISHILARSARLIQINVTEGALGRIAQSSRATPRVANRLLKRVRDFAQVHGVHPIEEAVANEALQALGVDEYGLEEFDRRVLKTVIEKFSGGPVGLQSIAAACAEEEDMITELVEPYLLRIGFLERTPRGRVATPTAYAHLGLSGPQSSQARSQQPTPLL